MELQTVMTIMERLESKVDDVRESIHEIDIKVSGTVAKQAWHDKEIETLKSQVVTLKESHDKAQGALKLLTIPGVLGFLYALVEVFKQ